jgi:hypothetical protein
VRERDAALARRDAAVERDEQVRIVLASYMHTRHMLSRRCAQLTNSTRSCWRRSSSCTCCARAIRHCAIRQNRPSDAPRALKRFVCVCV